MFLLYAEHVSSPLSLQHLRNRFMGQLNSSFGSGGMTLSLTEPQFSCFIQYLKDEGSSRGLPIQKAARHIGLQPGDIWVLGEDVQVPL